ncbi:SDR family NAD(P)-dependent oxidoreductase [Dyadobacter psychrophilus]|uniref:NAD(P)-dependent dehydrogenase, short-chain alcohol dehydrogenase family n=1 Tax=Dyadobacter psychrophilus TaxID=651661 RepID=A0A1T5ENY1_9BACT|nr:SDR family oxidoreductase [Dyadobacter psychrophilus]SKB85682.1 NAD(P)-dependent dehydrogenase, short-chain alcohol dehydrogenase family [Dyadobacter psychrophilus]
MEQGNKIALVTGASRGLGKNMALNLAEQGTDIIVIYRSKEQEAQEVVEAIEAMGRKSVAIQLDTANTKNFDAFFNALETVLETKWNRKTFDFLINNAGIDANSKFTDTTEDDFDALMNVHFKGVYFLTQKALPYIADNGRIINLSTGLTRFATPGYAAYASMKGAIEVLTKYLAKELGHRGITVNIVAPGIIHTDFTKKAFAAHSGMEDHINSITALGRVGEPQDIGAVVAFLCTEGARWINAQRIEASGGMNL